MAFGAAGLIVIALAFRFAGATLRSGVLGKAGRVIGWLICTSATWLAVGALGGWFPIWPSWVLGIVGAIAEPRLGRPSWILADLSMVVIAGAFSIPPIGLSLIVVSSGFVTGIGYAIDSLAEKVSGRFILGSTAIMVAGFIAVVFLMPSGAKLGLEYVKWLTANGAWPFVGIAPIQRSEQIELATGAIGWVEGRRREGGLPGALVFHGSDPLGSHQAAAMVLRRSLIDAGFTVLALDHLGYADSPDPAPIGAVEAYDPLPSVLLAYDLLREYPDVGDIYAFGHSMGSADTLRLLAASDSLCGGILLGASNSALTEDAEDRYLRFHLDREIEERIPFDLFDSVRSLYYDQERLARQISEGQTAIYFVTLENDWPNIVDSRDALFDALPAPKDVWVLEDSSHYFNSGEAAGVLIGDTRIARRLASWLEALPACSAGLIEAAS